MASRARKAMCQRAEPLGRFQETRGVPAPPAEAPPPWVPPAAPQRASWARGELM